MTVKIANASPSKSAILKEYDAKMRRDRPPGPRQRIERQPTVTRVFYDLPGAEFAAVVYSALDSGNADSAIEEQIGYFDARGRAFEWKLYGHDKPPDLEQRLVRKGFRPLDREMLLYLKVPDRFSVPMVSGISIRPLTRPAEIDALEVFDRTEGQALNPPLYRELREQMRGAPQSVSIYVAWDGEVPVARGWVRFYPERRFADLWGGGTLRAYRRRGIYRALVAARIEQVRQRGIAFITTDALPSSQPILESMGFRGLTWTMPLLWVPLG